MTISDRFVPDVQDGNGGLAPVPYQAVIASGAVTIAGGVVTLNLGSAIAATIGDPPTTMDGAVLQVISLTAQAHTLSNAAGSGFNAGGAASDIGTFGAAIGNSITLVASGGVWYVLNNVNVTLA